MVDLRNQNLEIFEGRNYYLEAWKELLNKLEKISSFLMKQFEQVYITPYVTYVTDNLIMNSFNIEETSKLAI